MVHPEERTKQVADWIGLLLLIFGLGLSSGCRRSDSSVSEKAKTNVQFFAVTGVVKEVNSQGRTVVVSHDEVPGYMPAMTMSFGVRETNELAGIGVSNHIKFRLNVVSDTSWIDQITPFPQTPSESTAGNISSPQASSLSAANPADVFTFTNEFGQPVKMSDFGGQALALNFIFTRCPLPNACPRSSQNFAEASERLLSTPGTPTNWHFLSVSIDSEFDTPAVLRAYGKRYNYNSNRWSFLTGPEDRIANLTRMFGFDFKPDSGVFSHGFRTVIMTPSNRVQQIYPISGNLTDPIVQDMLKALGTAPLK